MPNQKFRLEQAGKRLGLAARKAARARVLDPKIIHELAEAGYAFHAAGGTADDYRIISDAARHSVELELVAGGFIEIVEPPPGAKYCRYWHILKEWS